MLLPPKKRVWVIYNHVPGGNIMAQKFDHESREKRTGENQSVKMEFTPEVQIQGFEKSDFVALNRGGTIIKNKVLIYSGPAIEWDDPKAGDKVIAWARELGIREIAQESDKRYGAGRVNGDPRVDDLDKRMTRLEESNKETDAKVDKILAAVTAGGEK